MFYETTVVFGRRKGKGMYHGGRKGKGRRDTEGLTFKFAHVCEFNIRGENGGFMKYFYNFVHY